MRIQDLLESPDADNPFEDSQLSPREEAALEKRQLAYAKFMHTYSERAFRNWIMPGKLSKTTAKAKRKPGDEVVMYRGLRYLIITTDPVEREKIKKAAARLNKHVDVLANATTINSMTKLGTMAKAKQARWPQGDEFFLKELTVSKGKVIGDWQVFIPYIEYAIKSPWPELEKYIFKWPGLAALYVKSAYNGTRCSRYEDMLYDSLLAATTQDKIDYLDRLISTYTANHRKTPWPEVERFLLKTSYAEYPYQYLRTVKKSVWPEFEEYLLNRVQKNSWPDQQLWSYVKQFKGGKWPELASKISKEAAYKFVLSYAQTVVGGRWDIGENLLVELIKTRHSTEVDYAFSSYTLLYKVQWGNNVLKYMAQTVTPFALLHYAVKIMQKRWPEAEDKTEYAYQKGSTAGDFHYAARLYANAFLNGKWPAVGI